MNLIKLVIYIDLFFYNFRILSTSLVSNFIPLTKISEVCFVKIPIPTQ